jgi:hypothetical protein
MDLATSLKQTLIALYIEVKPCFMGIVGRLTTLNRMSSVSIVTLMYGQTLSNAVQQTARNADDVFMKLSKGSSDAKRAAISIEKYFDFNDERTGGKRDILLPFGMIALRPGSTVGSLALASLTRRACWVGPLC